MRSARRSWISDGKPRNAESITYNSYKNKKREFRKQKRNAEKKWYRQREEDLINSAETDIHEFYKTVKRIRKKGPGDKPLHYDGKTATDPQEKCDLWLQYYSNLLTSHNDNGVITDHEINVKDFVNNIYKSPAYKNDDINTGTTAEIISKSEISQQIKELKTGKAPGPDMVTNEHIKFAGSVLISKIQELIQFNDET